MHQINLYSLLCPASSLPFIHPPSGQIIALTWYGSMRHDAPACMETADKSLLSDWLHSQIAVLLGDLHVVCACHQMIRTPLYWSINHFSEKKMSLHRCLASYFPDFKPFVIPCCFL